MTTKRRPRTEPDEPAYPRRQEQLLARRGMLALLGGAASLSMVGCRGQRDERATSESAADGIATTPDSAQPAPSGTVSASGPEPTAVAGPPLAGAADAATAVVPRLPVKGHRTVAISPSASAIFAVELVHPDPKFGAYAEAHSAELLAVADAAMRMRPPYGWRDDDERAKLESALRTELQARLSQLGWVGAPITAVRLEVQSVEQRARRLPGVAPRHDR